MNTQATKGQSIELRAVSKSWDGIPAVQRVDIDVMPGTFTVLLGPSGCGKSTTLRIIAGLEFADEGEVIIGGADVSYRPPAQRQIAMVFQSYALFPHLTVAENILFGLKVRRTAKTEQQERLNRTAELLGLGDYLERKPAQLSGGQQQRVALGRAIIAEKPICLMDEPLSNLDAKLRHSMRNEIRELQRTLAFSMVYVTHDQSEAITMADQVVLMRNGRVEQAATPRQIYERPESAFVAGFIGTPPMNLIAADELSSHLSESLQFGDLKTILNKSDLMVGIRPEHLQIGDGPGLRAKISSVEYLGADALVDCEIGQSTLQVRVAGASQLTTRDTISLTWSNEDMHFFDAAKGMRIEGYEFT